MEDYVNRQIKMNLELQGEITDFQLTEKTNQHGRCLLKGVIEDESKDNIISQINGQEYVKVFLEEKGSRGASKQTDVFYGLVHELSIFQEGDVYTFHLDLISPTFLMDVEKKSRSFQDVNMTYLKLIQEVMKGYSGGEIFDNITAEKKLETLIVQYEETDWEFIKRLASHFHASVFPSSQFDKPKIYFGTRKQLDAGEMKTYEYKIKKEIGWLKKSGFDKQWELKATDAVSYEVKSHSYYEISSKVSFKGNPFYIKECEGTLESGETVFRYTLVTEQVMGQIRQLPRNLCGASLEGEVLKSIKDRIKVHLKIDKAQNEDTAWEFPYQTMYTAEGAGGWYCMPEAGDMVSIYFPSQEESDAVGTCSARTGENRDGKTDDPAIKYFRTIHGKEIRFTPKEVVITCGGGYNRRTGEKKKVKITLHQDEGITLETSENISFKSQAGIHMEAREAIEVFASDQIKLRCRKGKIQMDSLIDIAGPDVRIN